MKNPITPTTAKEPRMISTIIPAPIFLGCYGLSSPSNNIFKGIVKLTKL